MMWYGDDPGWGGWLLMTFGMIAFWTLIVVAVVAVVAVVRGLRDDGSQRRPAEVDPRRLLDERFARGEIDPDDYRTRRDLLRGR